MHMHCHTEIFRHHQGFTDLYTGYGGVTARANDLQVTAAPATEPAVQFAPEFVLHPVSSSSLGASKCTARRPEPHKDII